MIFTKKVIFQSITSRHARSFFSQQGKKSRIIDSLNIVQNANVIERHAFMSKRYLEYSFKNKFFWRDLGDLPTDGPLDKNKNPSIPEGHPIDTDGRPIGNIIPDYDMELPAFSYGGYSKDFEAWADVPVFPKTAWPEVARYNYDELEVNNFPVMYEVNMAYLLVLICGTSAFLAVCFTNYEVKRYMKSHEKAYKYGWGHFHYEPGFDIVPLTKRADGLPPETLVLSFDDEAMVRHEYNPEDDDNESD